jgi:hypothetical protein
MLHSDLDQGVLMLIQLRFFNSFHRGTKMGHSSILLAYHDHLNQTRKEKDLGSKIHDAIVGSNNHISSGVKVVARNISSGSIATVIVEGNTAYHLEKSLHNGGIPEWSDAEEHLVDILRQLGYKVTKPKKPKEK